MAGISASLISCRVGGDLASNSILNPDAPEVRLSGSKILFPVASPYVSNTNSIVISGSCPTGDFLTLSGASSGTTTCVASAFSFTVSSSVDGTYPYVITETSSSGQSFTPLSMVWIRKSTVAAPFISFPATSTYRSALSNLSVTGSCENGATVELLNAASVVATGLCASSSFSLNFPATVDATYNLSVRQTDLAGNQASTNLTWIKQSVAISPAASSVQVGANLALTVTGGSGTYTVALQSGATGAITQVGTTNVYTYTAGTVTGQTDTVTATDSLGSSVSTTVVSTSGVADHLEFGSPSGNSQSVNLLQTASLPFSVLLVDKYQNPIPNYFLFFQNLSGDAVLASSVVMTGLDGVANVAVTAGQSSVVSNFKVGALGATPLPDVNHLGSASLNFTFKNKFKNTVSNFGAFSKVASNPNAIATGDFNGDGIPDVLVLNAGSGNLHLFYGTSSGVFAYTANQIIPLTSCVTPSAVAVGAFRNATSPGVLDILVACSGIAGTNNGSFNYIKGTGTGSFLAAQNIAISGGERYPNSIAVADFDGDGNLDFAATRTGTGINYVTFRAGDGAGNFTYKTATNVGSGLFAINAANMHQANGTSSFDIVALSNSSGTGSFSVLTNNISGGTWSFVKRSTVITSNSPTAMVVSDFNADGFNDLAVVNASSNTVEFYINSQDGIGTMARNDGLTYPVGNGPSALKCVDMNKDGIKDLVVLNATDSTFMVLYLDATGATQLASNPTAISSAPTGFVVDDFNGDGNVDVVVTAPGSPNGQIQFIPGQSNLSFDFVTSSFAGNAPVHAVVADFDNDGKTDAAVLTGSKIYLLKGTGKGTYTSFTPSSLDTGDSGSVFVEAVDLRKNGKKDLLVVKSSTNRVRVFLGRGDGTFAAGTDFAVGRGPKALVIQDFDRDGNLDFATVNNLGNSVTVYYGDGTGAFPRSQSFALNTNPNPVAIAAADLNQDGLVDLVTSNADGTISVLFGSATTGFVLPAVVYSLTGAGELSGIVAADFNNDTKIDVAVSDSAGIVWILKNTGNGVLDAANAAQIGLSSGIKGLVQADVNGDGRVDLITPYVSTNQYAVILASSSAGASTAATGFFTSNSTQTVVGNSYLTISGIVSGDTNADAAVDLLILDDGNSQLQNLLGH